MDRLLRQKENEQKQSDIGKLCDTCLIPVNSNDNPTMEIQYEERQLLQIEVEKLKQQNEELGLREGT